LWAGRDHPSPGRAPGCPLPLDGDATGTGTGISLSCCTPLEGWTKRSNVDCRARLAAFADGLRRGTVAEGAGGRRGGGGSGGGGRLKRAYLLHLEHGRLPVEALRLGLRERQTRREERPGGAGGSYIVVVVEIVHSRRRRLGRRRGHRATQGTGNLAELGGQMESMGARRSGEDSH
jgi:hypothetical protein